MSSALIGRTLAGRFRITGFIGEGAMASVYRGSQEAEPRDVAIKVMHPQLAKDEAFVKRFRREAKAASRLNHPNSVHILEYGVDEELLYIVMELLTGRDLFEVLVVERRIAEARAARILIQALDALTVAHEQGVVHRDLKPENIMVMRDGDEPFLERVKVLDFGIAKILDRDHSTDAPASSLASSALTTVGVVVGTPEYMSPEQCRGEPVDARSDIYACGVLLFQLLTGRTPFSGDSPVQVAMMHLRENPPMPSSLVPNIHPALEAVLLMALNKWPAQRQPSARALAAELQRLLPELSTTPLRPTQKPLLALSDEPSAISQSFGDDGPLPAVDSDGVAMLAVRTEADPSTQAAGTRENISDIPSPLLPRNTPDPEKGGEHRAPATGDPRGAGQLPHDQAQIDRTVVSATATPMTAGMAPRGSTPLRIPPVTTTVPSPGALAVAAQPRQATTLAAAAYPSPSSPGVASRIAGSMSATHMGLGASGAPIHPSISPALVAFTSAPGGGAAGHATPTAATNLLFEAADEPADIHTTMASAIPAALKSEEKALRSPSAKPVPVALAPLPPASAGEVTGQQLRPALPTPPAAPFPWQHVSVAFSFGVVVGVLLALLMR